LSVIAIPEMPSLFQPQSNCWEQINYASSHCAWLRGRWRKRFSSTFLATRSLNRGFPDQRVHVLDAPWASGFVCVLAGLLTGWQSQVASNNIINPLNLQLICCLLRACIVTSAHFLGFQGC
jgi:hypothetical protein